MDFTKRIPHLFRIKPTYPNLKKCAHKNPIRRLLWRPYTSYPSTFLLHMTIKKLDHTAVMKRMYTYIHAEYLNGLMIKAVKRSLVDTVARTMHGYIIYTCMLQAILMHFHKNEFICSWFVNLSQGFTAAVGTDEKLVKTKKKVSPNLSDT